MSATRQIGNRLAFAWLVRELDRSAGAVLAWSLGDDPGGRPNPAWEPGRIGPGATGQPGRHAPRVEILDTGRKR